VVVRRVVGIRDGRPIFTDILGELLSFGDTELTVDAKDGPLAVPIGSIVAGKRIPPRGDRPSGGPSGVALR
jgi:hypothetical protein